MAGRSLGSLTLDLILKMGGFEQGMDKAARVTDKRMKDMESRARKFGEAMGTAIKIGATGAAVGMALYVKNTIEAEKVQAQLAARIKDTMGAAGRSIADLNRQADALQSITIFDDEAIGMSQALLLTFKEIRGVQFDKTIESALDLATVMGTDATSAAKILGRALSDPEKGMSALSRAGVVFTDTERELIKALTEAGETAKAQDAILAKLQGTMGSAAEAARNTLGGSLQGLKNAFDNLLEGDSGSEGVRGTVSAINNLADTMNDPDVKAGFQSITSGIASITAEVVGGIGAIERYIGQLRTLSSIDEKRKSGAPLASYTDRELQNSIALLSKGKNKAIDAGDTALVKKLQAEITALIREDSARMKQAARIGDWKEGRVTVGEGWAGVNGRPPKMKPPSPPGGGGGGGSSGRSRGGGSDRSFADDLEASRKLLDDQVKAVAAARLEFEGLSATLAGPLADANYRYSIDLAKLNELAAAGEVTTQDLAAAQANLRKEHEANVEAINKQLDPLGQLLADLEFENSLLGMTNAERMIAIETRGMDADAIAGQSAALAKLKDAYANGEQMREQIGLMDEFRDSVGGIFSDIRDGASAWDAVKDAFDNFADAIFDFASKKVMEQLFGQMGTSQTGSAGGGWLSLFTTALGAFAGGGAGAGASAAGGSSYLSWMQGGYASGGLMPANSLARVNENGPELMTVRGRDYLMTGNDAVTITPNHKLGGANGGVSVTQVFNNPRMYDRSTSAQREAEAARKLKDSMRFA